MFVIDFIKKFFEIFTWDDVRSLSKEFFTVVIYDHKFWKIVVFPPTISFLVLYFLYLLQKESQATYIRREEERLKKLREIGKFDELPEEEKKEILEFEKYVKKTARKRERLSNRLSNWLIGIFLAIVFSLLYIFLRVIYIIYFKDLFK